MTITIDLPKTNTTVSKIYAAYEDAQDGNGWREHLGASLIGRPCKRELWYSFHWVLPIRHPGRLLRLFDRGQREEAILTADLRRAGFQVVDIDSNTGKQYQFSDLGGHFGGSMDCAVLGIPEAPKTWHVGEDKTHNDKSFKGIVKDGVEKAKYPHFVQMHMYMGWSGMIRALYLAVNKNDDNIYMERVHFDKAVFDAHLAKAKQIIDSPEPLEKLSQDPAWYECKFCDYQSVCHGGRVPCVNCRTCAHSTPVEGGWKCEALGEMLNADKQREGCVNHLHNPKLIPFAEMIEADNNAIPRWVKYRMADGREFYNITDDQPKAPGKYYSSELHVLAPNLLNDENMDSIRVEFDAKAGG